MARKSGPTNIIFKNTVAFTILFWGNISNPIKKSFKEKIQKTPYFLFFLVFTFLFIISWFSHFLEKNNFVFSGPQEF